MRVFQNAAAVGLALVSIFAARNSGAAGNPVKITDEKAADYSKEAFVVERIVSKYIFENDGTYSAVETARVRVQSPAGVQAFGMLKVSYASATSTLDFAYIRVIKPDKRIVETPAENVLEMPAPITQEAPFYSDLKEKQVAVKGLEIGDELEYEYRSVLKTPLDPGQFWLAYNFFKQGICLDQELQLSVPRGRAVKVEGSKVQPSITDEGAYRVYTWKTANLESGSEKKDAKPAEPAEDVRPSVQLSSFQSWDDVGKWFKGLLSSRIVVTPQIQAKADELTRNAKTDPEKIQAIYDFASTKFRYIGIALGIGRYQPHPAADVLGNDYGDCKDKHTLFAALLAAEHINAYPALINSTSKLDREMPSPQQFDHVITAIPQGSGYLFLDTTPEVAPYGFLIAGLRDKEALVVPDHGPAILLRTPKDPPFKSSFILEADGVLSDSGTLQSKMHITLRTDYEVIYRLAFRRAGEAQWKDVMQQLSSALGYGGTVSDVSVTPPDATAAPFEIKYLYDRKDYGDWENRRILSPFPFIFLPPVPDDADAKSSPIKLGAPTEYSFHGTMKLPEKSDPYPPATVDLHQDFADYHSSYKVANGAIEFDRRLITKADEVTASQFEAYKKFTKAVDDDFGRFISLRGEEDDTYVPSEVPEARELYQQASKSWEARDMAAAADAFRQAVAKDPKYSQAWFWLGSADLLLGQEDRGIEEMKKAIALDPQRSSNYKYLANQLAERHRNDEAIEVWKDLEKARPEDHQAPNAIINILMGQERYPEAIEALQVALKRNPDDSQLRLELGISYLHEGNKEKGIESLQAAAKDPLFLHAVAYNFAEHDIQLQQALEYATKAVADVEKETAAISLDDLKLKDLQTVERLAQCWGTLGWVYLRLEKFGEAEKYLSAAWNLNQDGEVADNLGQTYEKLGKKHQAVLAYSRALADKDVPAQTRYRLETLRPGGKLLPGEKVDASALQDLRTLKLDKFPDKPKKHASAEFFVLFAPGPKVAGVKFISGSPELRDVAHSLSAAKFDTIFPSDDPAQIIRRGVLDCEPEVPGCIFVLIPPNSVRSVN